MLRSPPEYLEEIKQRVSQRGKALLAFIDPGTNAAARYLELSAPTGFPVCRPVAQEFYRCKGRSAGAEYTENSALLAKLLASSACFRTADFYFIENQYEKNVMITLGFIMGALAALRAPELETQERKRSEGFCVTAMPYRVIGISTHYKGAVIDALVPSGSDLKERAVAAAKIICLRDCDYATLQLMEHSAEAHDIADTVCYGESIAAYLRSGTEPPQRKAPRASGHRTK